MSSLLGKYLGSKRITISNGIHKLVYCILIIFWDLKEWKQQEYIMSTTPFLSFLGLQQKMYVKITSGTLPSFLIRCRSGFNSTTACVLFFSFFWTLAGSPVPLEPYNICVAPVMTISNPTDPPSDMPFSITCTQRTARFGHMFRATYFNEGLGPSSHTKSNSSIIKTGILSSWISLIWQNTNMTFGQEFVVLHIRPSMFHKFALLARR